MAQLLLKVVLQLPRRDSHRLAALHHAEPLLQPLSHPLPRFVHCAPPAAAGESLPPLRLKPSIDPDLQHLAQLIGGMNGTLWLLGDGGSQVPCLPQNGLAVGTGGQQRRDRPGDLRQPMSR